MFTDSIDSLANGGIFHFEEIVKDDWWKCENKKLLLIAATLPIITELLLQIFRNTITRHKVVYGGGTLEVANEFGLEHRLIRFGVNVDLKLS